MVGANLVVSEPVPEMTADPLSHAACIDEDQRSTMFQDEGFQPFVNLLPDFNRHHRLKRRLWNFNSQIQSAPMAAVNNAALRCAVAGHASTTHQKASYFFDRPLCGRQTDALQPAPGECFQPFDR